MFLPRLISWNVTYECNLSCDHCYIDAVGVGEAPKTELTTEEGKRLLDQIAELSKTVVVLSGGEPLLRKDIYELASHGTENGLRMVMGTNGILIDDEVAGKLKEAGVMRAGISIDSIHHDIHDKFRGEKGALQKAINGAKSCERAGLSFQIHSTVTTANYDDIAEQIQFAIDLGADAFHVFFLVPTGRAKDLVDITPQQYETALRQIVENMKDYPIEVRPVCAPQFMRIASRKDILKDMKHFTRGCLAGTNYCRVKPDGDVNPCPYLPIYIGNVKEESFVDIWKNSEVFNKLRDFDNLKEKCGICEFKDICGGCRARAYAYTEDYLKEEPWCVYEP